MERSFSQTLSFDDLDVIVLVENGGATPRAVEESLGMGRRETRVEFQDLVRRRTTRAESSKRLCPPIHTQRDTTER